MKDRIHAVVISSLAICTTVAWAADRQGPVRAPQSETGTGSSVPWANADPGTVLEFPRDHGAHPGHRVEWWYWTGNVTGDDGRRFGYQLTFFRTGINPSPPGVSRWEVRDLYLAHFAVSDIDRRQFYSAERLHRAGIARAGATEAGEQDAHRVWNGEWSARIDVAVQRLSAYDPGSGVAINLSLEPTGPPVMNGTSGYSKKGASPGNASTYYSMPRLATRGTVTIGDREHRVAGESWLDHEFGTSFLEEGQVGWDWFALHLDDGSAVMLYRLRRSGGETDPHSAGTLVGADGSVEHLGAGDFSLTPTRTWASPASGANYPVEWTVLVPGAKIALEIEAAFDGQEFLSGPRTGIDYWEGAVQVDGTHRGSGYLELTGYSGQALGRALR